MTAKEYLLQADRARESIHMLMTQINSLNAAMESIGRATSDGSKVQSTPPKDPQGDRIARIVDRKTACETKLAEWREVLADVAVLVSGVDCPTCYRVLFLRYIDGACEGRARLDLRDIAEKMNYSVAYVRDLHAAGIREIKVPE